MNTDNLNPEDEANSVIKDVLGHIEKGTSANLTPSQHVGVQLAAAIKAKHPQWKHAITHSKCAVASFEEKLEVDGVRISIIESNFLGPFTQIEVSK